MEKIQDFAFNNENIEKEITPIISNDEIIEEVVNTEPVEEIIPQPTVEPVKEEKKEVSETNSSLNFDSLFDNLYSDVAGAKNFMASLVDQKKTISINEAYLAEEKEKLDKAKAEFDRFTENQKESIALEKKRIEEYEKAQKIRLENEQAAFNEEVVNTRKNLELTASTNRNEMEKIEKEKDEFNKYKAAEEEAIKLANEKLEMEKAEFAKYKEIEETKIEAAKNKNQLDREAFEKEKANANERIRLANEELETSRQEFEKYKDVEKQKLELESKNLSQSCARFKELVSQFNSGFKVLPEEDK